MNATFSSKFGSIVDLNATYWGGAVVNSTFGMIAQLLYADEPPLDFVRVVADLHRTLSQLGDRGMSFGWDGADLAVFDLSAVRIVLGVNYRPGGGYSACLTVAVEFSANGSEPVAGAGCEDTCSSVVEHVHRRYPAVTTLWHPSNAPLTNTLHHRLVAALPPLAPPATDLSADDVSAVTTSEQRTHADDEGSLGAPYNIGTRSPEWSCSEPEADVSRRSGAKGSEPFAQKSRSRIGPRARDRAARARARGEILVAARPTGALPLPEIAIDTPPCSPPCLELLDTEVARVRGAFNQGELEPAAPRLSTPLRLSAHLLNASLILVWAPLGTAVMTYSLLNGEDMRFSGRMVALTGLIGAALNTPIGQYMAVMLPSVSSG